MNVTQYTLLAYVLGIGLMVGYGLLMWAESRQIERRKKSTRK